jgi:hypothetical protein
LNGVRIVIPYWFGWGPFSFLVFWNLVNLQMGYWQWQGISRGIVGPRSWDRLHLSEVFVLLGLCAVLWLAAAREVITVDPTELKIRKEILGLGWSKKHAVADVSWIRAGCLLRAKAAGRWNPNHVRAALYFSSQGSVGSFANELSMEDAVGIERVIQNFLDARKGLVVEHRASSSA